jgi:cytochrome c556
MQLVWTRKVLAAAAASAFVGLLAVPGTAKDPLPDGGAAKQQTADLAFLKAAVDKKAKNSIDPVRATAVLVAQSAQNRMDGKADEELAGLRDQMLKLSDALADPDKPDWAAAAKALDGVQGAKGAKDGAKPHEAKEFDAPTLMNIFKKSARGGRGWEDDLIEFAQGKKAVDADRALELAQGSVLVAQLAEHLVPEGTAGAKKKEWDKFVADMQKAGQAAAEEAVKGKKGDAAVLKKKLEAMEANCVACHKVFK